MRTWPLLVALSLPACFGGAQNDAFQPTTGSFDVTLTAPRGVLPKVTLHGPESFTKVLNGSATLTGLVAGSYWFEAPAVVLPTSIIDTVYSIDLPAAPLLLGAGKVLESKLEYQQRPGTGAIWLTHFGDSRLIGGWLSDSLLKGGNPPADARVLTSYSDMLALQIDPAGNLWLLAEDVGLESFVVFSWKTLLPGESQPAPRVLQAGERLLSFTFDSSGGVWCVTRNAYLVHYSAAQLATGDLAQADVTLHGAAASLTSPVALAFDAVGNLWVADAAGAGSLNRFSPRQLAATSYAAPASRLQTPAPSALAFDAAGSAWVASGGKLLQFDPAQLGGAGAAAGPTATLDFGAVQIHSWGWDALGELWVTYTSTGTVQTSLGMLTASQLAVKGAGTVTPYVPLSTALNRGGPSFLLVDPPAAGTPLYGLPR